jgi:hypothetical protein
MPPYGNEFWVLIPVVAILSGVLKTWVKQRALGASNTELEKEIAEMRRERTSLSERLQNLEAIVVSQTWDAVHAPHATQTERELRIASVAHRELTPPDPSEINQQRVQQLAQRLGR